LKLIHCSPGWTRLNVNLTGPFLVTQAAAQQMVKQGKGSIINIGSTYGLGGPDQRIYEKPGQPKVYKPVYYTVTKAGILGLTKYLATYYAGSEIRVNALTPGGVTTTTTRSLYAIIPRAPSSGAWRTGMK